MQGYIYHEVEVDGQKLRITAIGDPNKVPSGMHPFHHATVPPQKGKKGWQAGQCFYWPKLYKSSGEKITERKRLVGLFATLSLAGWQVHGI